MTRKIHSPYSPREVFEVPDDHFGVELAEQRIAGWRLAHGDKGFEAQQKEIQSEKTGRTAKPSGQLTNDGSGEALPPFDPNVERAAPARPRRTPRRTRK